MAINLTTVTGAAVTGLTTPTYTMTADISSGAEKSWIVTALGGTQTGVLLHSSSNPFSIKIRKASSIKPLPRFLPNGLFKSGGKNKFSVSVIKGMLTLTGQPQEIGMLQTDIQVPSGADMVDQANIKAVISLFGGFWNGNGDGLVTMLTTNTI